MKNLVSFNVGAPVAGGLLLAGLVIGVVIGKVSERNGDSPLTAEAESEGPVAKRSGSLRSSRTGNAPLALHQALGDPDPVESSLRFASMVKSLPAADFETVAKALWATPGEAREMNERKRLLTHRWGQVDGAAAVEFSNAQAGPGKVAAISAALAGWASVDPAAAKAWIDGQGDDARRMLYDFALVDGWARRDLAGATNYVLGLSQSRNTERLIRIAAGEHLRQHPETVGAWALQLPEGSLKAAAIDEVATRWVWADPPAAIDWVAGIPEADRMQTTMDTAMGIWTRTDPAVAGAYLEEMPEGQSKDHALAAFSQAAAPEAPETSAAWAATISDPTLREESLVAVAGTWLRQDPEAAQAWMAQSGLSQEALSRVGAR